MFCLVKETEFAQKENKECSLKLFIKNLDMTFFNYLEKTVASKDTEGFMKVAYNFKFFSLTKNRSQGKCPLEWARSFKNSVSSKRVNEKAFASKVAETFIKIALAF